MKVGDKVKNIEIELINGRSFNLHETLKKGPVVLNFIMGTWCPFCYNHLNKIRSWQDAIGKNVTMIIISSEKKEILRTWSEENVTSYLFASDPQLKIINEFSVKSMILKTASPATILIDRNHEVRMIFDGIRTEKSRKTMLNNIVENA